MQKISTFQIFNLKPKTSNWKCKAETACAKDSQPPSQGSKYMWNRKVLKVQVHLANVSNASATFLT